MGVREGTHLPGLSGRMVDDGRTSQVDPEWTFMKKGRTWVHVESQYRSGWAEIMLVN